MECISCGDNSHSISYCPFVNPIIRKPNYLKEEPQVNQRSMYTRKRDNICKTRINLVDIQASAREITFQLDKEQVIDELYSIIDDHSAESDGEQYFKESHDTEKNEQKTDEEQQRNIRPQKGRKRKTIKLSYKQSKLPVIRKAAVSITGPDNSYSIPFNFEQGDDNQHEGAISADLNRRTSIENKKEYLYCNDEGQIKPVISQTDNSQSPAKAIPIREGFENEEDESEKRIFNVLSQKCTERTKPYSLIDLSPISNRLSNGVRIIDIPSLEYIESSEKCETKQGQQPKEKDNIDCLESQKTYSIPSLKEGNDLLDKIFTRRAKKAHLTYLEERRLLDIQYKENLFRQSQANLYQEDIINVQPIPTHRSGNTRKESIKLPEEEAFIQANKSYRTSQRQPSIQQRMPQQGGQSASNMYLKQLSDLQIQKNEFLQQAWDQKEKKHERSLFSQRLISFQQNEDQQQTMISAKESLTGIVCPLAQLQNSEKGQNPYQYNNFNKQAAHIIGKEGLSNSGVLDQKYSSEYQIRCQENLQDLDMLICRKNLRLEQEKGNIFNFIMVGDNEYHIDTLHEWRIYYRRFNFFFVLLKFRKAQEEFFKLSHPKIVQKLNTNKPSRKSRVVESSSFRKQNSKLVTFPHIPIE